MKAHFLDGRFPVDVASVMASTSGPNPPPCNLPPCNPPACKPPSCKPSPCKSLPCPAGCPPPPLYDTSQCSTSLDRPIPTKNQPSILAPCLIVPCHLRETRVTRDERRDCINDGERAAAR
ncbi:hypothetical protein PUN28_013266 [Cardiocondyla obscurior]|uniref:Uncharacterized protein n=1 Tax=Cardiocondyla obscurior TaxID=286306 RepID=A0AAW2FAE4_9HYME